ncbi:DUF1667 domain-containing protein [Spirulina major CS-329]|uniref:DUF1667 domain-containing protein n=1 Tax=Spirulina TaxID=1154 RepID=UPI0023310705|nr:MULTISPECIES: DUF1667 domain-containing protein [Spirulina]MDB9494572.1 DUF1667 domain-containing protein [Spirulina subsalsa CS-330]MDB9504630.1 DUF1667 domain-containing protein [Spirulina major CS-329]
MTALDNAQPDTLSHYLCIGCPMGCRLEVETEPDHPSQIVEVRGFSCRRGEQYAHQEHTEPRRMVTTTVKIDRGIWARVPVKTLEPIPKGQVKDLCIALRQVCLTAPVERGAVVLADALGTGVDVVTSRSMAAATFDNVAGSAVR